MRASDALLLQAVRGHFHRHGTRAGVMQRRQAGLQLHRVGRGEAGRLQGTGEAGAERADGRARGARGLQHARQPLAARGLAVGAGDAGHGQAAHRIAVPAGSDRAGKLMQVADRQVRHDIAKRPVEAVGLIDDGAGASRDGLLDIGPPVGGQALVAEHVGEEHVAARQPAAIAGQLRRSGHVGTQPGQRVAGLGGHLEREQGLGRHWVAVHGSLSGTLSLTTSWRIGESGWTFSARSVPPVMAANAGPATRPP
ncbi:hypothetical protein D9M70_408720 [compost metagenome]